MAFCIHCGAPVSDDARFCTSCGKPLTPATAAPPVKRPAAATGGISGNAGAPGKSTSTPASSGSGESVLSQWEEFIPDGQAPASGRPAYAAPASAPSAPAPARKKKKSVVVWVVILLIVLVFLGILLNG